MGEGSFAFTIRPKPPRNTPAVMAVDTVHCAKRLFHPGASKDQCPCVCVRTRFRWFLRRVQALRTRSYPPRQFFRNLSTVYFSNPHKQRLANDGSIFWDPFLDPPFLSKKVKILQKSTSIYWFRKWSKWSKNALRATCPAGCNLVKAYNLQMVRSQNKAWGEL